MNLKLGEKYLDTKVDENGSWKRLPVCNPCYFMVSKLNWAELVDVATIFSKK